MDTLVSITIYAKEEPENWRHHVAAAFDSIRKIEELATSYNDSSQIGQLNLYAGQKEISVHKDILGIIEQAEVISKLSDGAFDITILPLLRLWNFKSPDPRIPADTEISDKLNLVDYRRVRIKGERIFLPEAHMGVDLSAIAKGFAVDRAIETLKNCGYKDFLVEAGGDLRAVAGELTRGRRRIWVRHPRKLDGFFATIKMNQGAVATSGDYERFFEMGGQRFHHILDPRTGYPASPIVSVTIIANAAALADAYATAVFVLGPERGLDLVEKTPEMESLIVYKKDSDSSSTLYWKVSEGIAEDIEVIED